MSKSLEELPKYMRRAIDSLSECTYLSDTAYGKGHENTKKIKEIIAELAIMNSEFMYNSEQ